MDRRELGDFLRTRRERIGPPEVGLPAGTRRRTPGLRREEVAQLAFISPDYYARLEQARAPRPSREVLAGLARALRLSDAERDHLHHLAGEPPTPAGLSTQVRECLVDLVERLPLAAATVVSATFEVIAWNPLAAALMEDFSLLPRRERNLARRAFLGPEGPTGRLYGACDLDAFTRHAAARLRAVAARHPHEPEVRTLVEDLRAGSPRFRELWASHDVDEPPGLRKSFRHPRVGEVVVNANLLEIPDRGQQLIIYTADPGSPSERALQELAHRELAAQRSVVML